MGNPPDELHPTPAGPPNCIASPQTTPQLLPLYSGNHGGPDLGWIPYADPGTTKTCIYSELGLGFGTFSSAYFIKNNKKKTGFAHLPTHVLQSLVKLHCSSHHTVP